MCDCSNYCQLLVGPRRRAPHHGSFVDARRWAFGRVAAPARLATARSSGNREESRPVQLARPGWPALRRRGAPAPGSAPPLFGVPEPPKLPGLCAGSGAAGGRVVEPERSRPSLVHWHFSMIKSPRTPETRARTHFDCSCFHFFHPVTYPFGEKCYQALRATAATRQVPQNGGTPSSLRLRAATRGARPRPHRPRAKFVEGLLSEQQRAYGAQRTRGASS